MQLPPYDAFKDSASPQNLFASEEDVIARYEIFKDYTKDILKQSGLLLTQKAYDFMFEVFSGKKRKDGETPSSVHELRHFHVGKSLLQYDSFITPDVAVSYGTEDAFYGALAAHDMLEARVRRSKLQQELQDALGKKINLGKMRDISNIMMIVDCMTRREDQKILGVRDMQMEQLIQHPYAFPSKQIDWCDKLATMIGVVHFEEDNLEGMIKVLKETSRYFMDENLGYARKAEELFPFARKAIRGMDRIMGLQYHILLYYVHAHPGNEEFKKEFKPKPLAEFLPETMDVLQSVPRGIHYIHNMIDRMSKVAKTNPAVRRSLKENILPQLLPLKENEVTVFASLSNIFKRASSIIKPAVARLISSLDHVL